METNERERLENENLDKKFSGQGMFGELNKIKIRNLKKDTSETSDRFYGDCNDLLLQYKYIKTQF